MATKKRKMYVQMTEFELQAALDKRRVPAWEREEVLTRIKIAKEKHANDMRSFSACRTQWEPILSCIIAQRQTIRFGSTYKTVNDGVLEYVNARRAAFDALDLVLVTVYQKVRALKVAGIFPAQYAKEKSIPNGGVHWTDWVPEKIKDRVNTLFSAIPYVSRAKRKEPFSRDVNKTQWAKQYSFLDKTIEGEVDVLTMTIRMHEEHPMDTISARLRYEDWKERRAELYRASVALKNFPVKTALPRTWHGLVEKKKRT